LNVRRQKKKQELRLKKKQNVKQKKKQLLKQKLLKNNYNVN
jgi:hypothetical protein